jgi:SAM-dependent methyltransferase
VWLYLERCTDLFTRPQRLLHVAPSDPMYQDRLRVLPNLDYISIDLDAPEAMLRMDVTALEFYDATFHAVICSHVLEHVPDDGAALRELRRVLRPDGWAVLQSPVDASRAQTYEDPSVQDPAARAAAFNQADHVRIYGRDYRDRLAAAGFAVTEVPYITQLSEEEVRRYGLDPVEPVYLCRPAP